MAKNKILFYCQNCGQEHPKWQGQCSGCGLWNTLVEELAPPKTKTTSNIPTANYPKKLKEIADTDDFRYDLVDEEMSRVLGGGLVPGSIILLGGEPGIGKSTLLLQIALQQSNFKVLYVSGEESERQIKMRASRIPYNNDNLSIFSETQFESIARQILELEPDILVIDSIQTIYVNEIEAAPGSVSQIRECTSRILKIAKENNIPVFLIGHVTKEGQLAGPKVLEHMVDTVLTFEGDRHQSYRLVRTTKNRFGSTAELGIYEMQSHGLIEIKNPSELFINSTAKDLSGVAISATLEGNRPLLIEAQALVTDAAYGTPQRSATGFDLRRMAMLLAVLEKKCGFKMGMKDVFLNIAGGIRSEDPALDLGLAIAVVSSLYDLPINPKMTFSAEIGLTGEIRPVSRLEQRISEAQKLGFEYFICAENQKYNAVASKFPDIQIIAFEKIQDVFQFIFRPE